MRLYGIYKVKMKYEQFMIGREPLLYDLLKGHIQRRHRMQEVRYLCEMIEIPLIEHIIVSKLEDLFESIVYYDGEYELTHSMKGTIRLTMTPYALIVRCQGSRMLDLDLFVALSEVNCRFFAVMEGQYEWGWLKPVKQTKEKLKSTTVLP